MQGKNTEQKCINIRLNQCFIEKETDIVDRICPGQNRDQPIKKFRRNVLSGTMKGS